MTATPQVLGATGPFMFSPLGWTMDLFAEAGYTGVEVLFSHSAETRDSDKICNFAREAGLSVPVVHGPYMLFLRTVFSANYVDKSRRALERPRGRVLGYADQPSWRPLAGEVTGEEVEYEVGLPGEGAETEVFFSDLSHGYVRINAEYTT